MRLLGCLLLAAAAASAGEWALAPALPAHDPTLLQEDGVWWCFSTGQGLKVASSPDGRTWTPQPAALPAERPWWRDFAKDMRPLDVWAPDLHVFGGRTWLFYSVSEFGRNNSAIGALSCTSLARGDWRDEGLVLGSRRGQDAFNAIDPSLTTDAAGRPWLVFGSWFDGIQLVPLDPVTLKPAGPITALARGAGGIEAPNLVWHDGWYHLFVSIDVCCQGVKSTYRIAHGRARDITGPYVDRSGQPLLAGGRSILEAGGERWKGPGGQDVVRTADGRWLLARHAYDAANQGRPALRVHDLAWDADGWPVLAP